MSVTKLSASKRTTSGKGPARRLRRAGRIPAVAYGRDLEVVPIAVSPDDLTDVLRSEYGKNSLLELHVDGEEKVQVLLKDYQYHPVTRCLLHADFIQVREDRPVAVDVPLELTGKARGVIMGGILRHVYRRLPVVCLPKDIPVKISHDVTELEIDDQVKAGDVAVPAGVAVQLPPEQTVVAVVVEKVKEEEVEAAPAAEGVEAAPEGEGEQGTVPEGETPAPEEPKT